MEPHSSTLAWKIPWTEEPTRLLSPWGHKELDMTEWLPFLFFLSYRVQERENLMLSVSVRVQATKSCYTTGRWDSITLAWFLELSWSSVCTGGDWKLKTLFHEHLYELLCIRSTNLALTSAGCKQGFLFTYAKSIPLGAGLPCLGA